MLNLTEASLASAAKRCFKSVDRLQSFEKAEQAIPRTVATWA